MIATAALALLLGQMPTPSPRAAQLERELLTRPAEARLYLALAGEYERRSELARAEIVLRDGLKSAVDTKLARAGLIDFLVRRERWRDAVAEALPLATDSAGRSILSRLRVNAGIAAYRAGNRPLAISDWRQALVDDPTSIEPAVNLATALLEAGRSDSARAVLTSSLRWHPDNGRLLAMRARTLTGADALPATIKALRQLRAERPDDEQIGLELAHLLVNSGGPNRLAGIVLLDSLVTSPNASERVFTVVAEVWLDASQPKTAASVAESGIIKYPRSATLWSLLAEAKAALQPPEWRAAGDAYKRAIALVENPESLEASLMEVYIASSDTSNALYLARDLVARPASAAALLDAASRITSLGSQGQALADSLYAHLLARDSTNVAAIEAGGVLARTRGDTTRAIALFARAVTLDSSGPEPPLALLRLTRPRADSAQRLLRQAIWRGFAALQALELSSAAAASAGGMSPRRLSKLRPQVDRRANVLATLRSALDTVVFHTAWGKAELEQLSLAYPRSALVARYVADLAAGGQSDADALASYERLLRREPANAELQVKRAILLERLGRVDDAIDAYTRAFDLEPDNDSTFRVLQRLRMQRGSLDALLTQVRRLRARSPESRVLADHEIEVLSRLGRYAEAQDAAKKLKEAKP